MTNVLQAFQTINSTIGRSSVILRAQRLGEQDEYGFLRITNGFVTPGLTCVTLPINVLLIGTFLRGRLSKPAPLTLGAIAIIEILSSTCNLIPSIYFYTLGYGEEYTPFPWCLPRDILFRIVPAVCRTWSLNLIVLLALQRVLLVKRPYRINVYFTSKKTIIFIIIAGIVAVGSNIPMMIMVNIFSEIHVQSFLQPNKTIIGCTVERVNITNIGVSDLVSKIFSRIIPSSLLVIFDAYLLMTIKRTMQSKLLNLGMQEQQLSRRNSETNRLTLIIFSIICCILVVDIPGMSVHFYFIYANEISCRKCNLEKLFGVLYLCDLLVYSSSFFIYCSLSKDFRHYIYSCDSHSDRSIFNIKSFKLSLKPRTHEKQHVSKSTV